jgi:branched-chain amino acid transport system substrate-binding protein
MEIKIGVLLPRSDMFSTLAIDFLNGIKLPFKLSNEQNYVPKFIIESIGNATNPDLLQRIEQMMLQDETDIIVSFCSYFMLDNLIAIANSYKKPIIHVSLGARVLKPAHVSPYVTHISLNLCQTSYLSGKYAVEKYGKKVAMLSSFYDGGYHLAESFYNGVIDHGGEIVYNYVSPLDYKSETFQTMIEGVETSKPDVLLSLFSYKEGNKVLEKLTESGLDLIPNIAIPLLTDESIVIEGSAPKSTYSIASWAFDDDTNEMKSFVANYTNEYEEAPTIFSLLGEEIGEIISNAIHNEGKVPKKIGDYFQNRTISSSRGTIRFTELNESIPELFKIRKLEKINDLYKNEVIEVLHSSLADVLYKKMENLPNTGWKNPYICT